MGCVCTKERGRAQTGDFSFSKERLRSCKKRSSDTARFDGGKRGNANEEKPMKTNGVSMTTTALATMKILSTVDEKREKQGMAISENPRPRNPPRHIEGEQIAAGWPAWLSAVAREAIQGWIPRRADSFEKLDKIGQGTYSNVYKARDLETGKIVALKKVRFDNLEQESVRFMAREIQVLRRLDHPNVIKLEGLVTSRMSCSLYLVFEYMEHDLAGLSASLGKTFTESQVKCYLQQLLRGLNYCHGRGVLHRDIKGSNLLLDNSGILKIADFGLATFFHPDQKQPLTSRVVTLWYRPPELLLGATEYGVAVDLWSTGCILAELLAGKPIMPGRTEVEQLHKIFKLCGSPSEEYWKKSKLPHATIFKPKQPYKRCIRETFKDFPPSALVLIETLLAIEPADRSTAADALDNEFFKTKPFACDPSSLPKYPPSKELDAKLRDEESRRHRAAGGRAHGVDAAKKVGYTSKAVAAPEANAELATSIQARRLASYSSVKSQSEKFNPRQEEAVGFPIEPPNLAQGTAVYRHHNGAYAKKHEEDSRMATSESLRSQPFHNSQISSQPARDLRNAEQKQASVPTRQREGPGVPEAVKQQGFNAGQAGRMHFSGPLLYPSANVDEILGQHERQIQQAVRRSRQGKIYYEGNVSSQAAWQGLSNGNVRVGESGKAQEMSQMSYGQRSKPLKRTDSLVLPSLIENSEREHEV